MRTLFVAVSLGLIASGCGSLIRRTYKAEFDADNASAYPLTVTAKVEETAMVDDCTDSSSTDKVVVAPGASGHGEARLTCGYEPRAEVAASITRTDLEVPPGYSYSTSIRLIDESTPVTRVRVLEAGLDSDEPRETTVTSNRMFAFDLPEGVSLGDAFTVDYTEFYTDEVRAKREGIYVLLFMSSKESRQISAIGVPAELVPEEVKRPTSPYARTYGYELDGYWYEDVYQREFGRTFSFEKKGAKAKIRCDAAGCTIR